ncbi:hypothetical protein PAEVO_13670 [Paenibacillus sp. GM2FR]|nr:hypothetical protein PAEVO_13670 [Paenibacillus sp. GM2FR]
MNAVQIMAKSDKRIRIATLHAIGGLTREIPDRYGRHKGAIAGYDANRRVTGVHFRNLRINGEPIMNAEAGHFQCNEFQRNVTFD